MEIFDKILGHVSDELTDGDGESGGGESGGGGWEGVIGGFIDRFSGGDGGESGDGDSPLSGLTDRLGTLLPDGIREQAESWLRGDGEGGNSSAGSLTGWNALADRGLNLLRGTDSTDTGGAPFAHDAPDGSSPSRYDLDGPDVVNGPTSSPGVTKELGEAAERRRAVDTDGDGMPDDPTFYPAHAPAVVAHPVESPAQVDAPAPVEAEPMDDFQQAIDDADAMEDSFDSMLEGLQ